PHLIDSYRLHADYWDFMGRTDMAAKVMRSIDSLRLHPRKQNKFHRSRSAGLPIGDTDLPPDWDSNFNWSRPPRILIITHNHSDYGMDCLYHGLCSLIGKANVVEFPWKPTLHGQNKELTHNYPCFFNYPGTPQSVAQLVEELKEGSFDFILFGDVVKMEHPDEVRQLCAAAPDLPVILYDTWDDCYTPINLILDYIGRDGFHLIFKREMLAGLDYGPNTFPLPFGYPEENLTQNDSRRRDVSIFWAGKMEYGLRPLYIPAL
ncbi:MAG: hypothetical protein P8X55_19325, partial [Desulfosarcinaceae bacterium]